MTHPGLGVRVALEAPVGAESEGQVKDLIEDEASAPPDIEIEHLMDRERVDDLMGVMSGREKEILDLRFGLSGSRPHTLAEVARKFGLSRERVRQIEEAALKKLRKFVRDQEEEL